MTDRPLHPVARGWLESAAPLATLVADALAAAPAAERPMLEAMLLLAENTQDPDAWPRSLDHARRVELEARPPELTLLFLLLWARMAHHAGRAVEVAVLHRRLEASWDDGLPAPLRHCIADAAAMVADLAGDRVGQETACRAVADCLRPTPRHALALLDLMELLSAQGRTPEIRSEVEAALAAIPDGPARAQLAGWIALVELQDALERADERAARAHLAAVEAAPAIRDARPERLATARALINLMARGRGAAPPLAPPETVPRWVQVLELLLERRAAEAFRLAQEFALDDPRPQPGGPGLPAFTLLRAALAARQVGAATLVLDRVEPCMHPPHLDALFRARLAWLTREPERAARLWRLARRVADACGHAARLDFELRLACELTPSDSWELGRLAATLPEDGAPAEDGRDDRARPILVGPSPAMARVREAVGRFAVLDLPVLITGPTGTGKEVVARALHATGPRAGKPFEALNCGAVAESLLESELFGHERGAFTGATRRHPGLIERAGDGTLFLDEVGEMPPRLQAALLRVLETRDYRPVGSETRLTARCRVLAATNRDLERDARGGRFREDLWFRLQRLEIVLPALADRPEDVLPLVRHFLATGRRDGATPELSPALEQVLRRHRWRGNVRELQSVVERMRIYNADALHYEVDVWNAARRFQVERRRAERDAEPVTPSGSNTPLHGFAPPQGRRAPLTPAERRAVLLALFQRHGRLRRKDVERLMGVSGPTATADLRALVAGGRVREVNPTGSPRTQRFELAE